MDEIVHRLREFASRICTLRDDKRLENKAVLARAAADEIERLRAELQTNNSRLRARDEYAQEWKAALDQLDGLSGVEWVRAYVAANSPSEYSHPVAAEVVARTDAKLTAVADELAATIRKLQMVQAERDEARREICMAKAQTTLHALAEYAKSRGWDCFHA